MQGQETLQNTWLMICGYHLLYFKYETFHRAGAALISSELATRDHLTKLTGSWDFYSNRRPWRCADIKTRLKLICFTLNTLNTAFFSSLSNPLTIIIAGAGVPGPPSRCLSDVLLTSWPRGRSVSWYRDLIETFGPRHDKTAACIICSHQHQDVPTLTSPVLTN